MISGFIANQLEMGIEIGFWDKNNKERIIMFIKAQEIGGQTNIDKYNDCKYNITEYHLSKINMFKMDVQTFG